MLHIHTFEVTPFAQNARLLIDDSSMSACIIDPGGDIEVILEPLKEYSLNGLDIVLTHAHIDHGGGVANCLEAAKALSGLEVTLYAHSEPALRGTIAQQAAVFGLPSQEFKDVPDPDVLLDDGMQYRLGELSADVLWTPGHAPDHISLYFASVSMSHHGAHSHPASGADEQKPLLIAGDTLFQRSIGRTDLPGGSHPTLITSIKDKLLTLPEDTLVLCGHGPNTTIGEEKVSNPFLQ